jgi:hypothetical protein
LALSSSPTRQGLESLVGRGIADLGRAHQVAELRTSVGTDSMV